MKKVLAILSIVALASCGGNSTTPSVQTDSTTVKADTTLVDTTSTPKVVDTVKVVEEVK